MPRHPGVCVAPGSRDDGRSSVGLALAGGGPLGGIYEVGALLALTDSLDGIDFADLDVYVGVSSGGFVAAALANGISPAQMYRLFIDDGADAALTPEVFLRPAFAEFAHRAALVPGLLARAAWQALSDPVRRGVMESLGTLSHAVPTGMFDNRSIDRFLQQLFAAPGRTNDFRQAGTQALPRGDESRHRCLGDIRRARTRARADIQGDRGLGGVARPVPARPDRQRVFRRRRAQQDLACIGRARGRRGSPPVRQSAGAVRRQRGGAQRPDDGRQAEPWRPADRAVADFPRHHPFADEGRDGKIPPAISARRCRPVRAAP